MQIVAARVPEWSRVLMQARMAQTSVLAKRTLDLRHSFEVNLGPKFISEEDVIQAESCAWSQMSRTLRVVLEDVSTRKRALDRSQ